MNEAEILATTYTHKAQIFAVFPEEQGAFDHFEEEYLYEIACALSFKDVPTGGLTDTVQPIDYVATLFTLPDAEIYAGYRVLVEVGHRNFYNFIAQEPLRYVSHLEVPLIRKDEA